MYELKHLKNKLKVRDPIKYNEIEKLTIPDVNPLFSVVVGDIETWEVVKNY